LHFLPVADLLTGYPIDRRSNGRFTSCKIALSSSLSLFAGFKVEIAARR